MNKKTKSLLSIFFLPIAFSWVIGEKTEIPTEEQSQTEAQTTETTIFRDEIDEWVDNTTVNEEGAKNAKTEVKEEIKKVFGDNWEIAFAVAQAENRQLDAKAKGYNQDKRRTIDRGIFQINSYWHKEVDDVCAYDMRCNVKEAFRISDGGTNWGQWWTWKNGKHLEFL